MAGVISKAIEWMQSKRGRVTYSMARRNGPSSYDCSSAVFYALRHAGFPYTSHIGNTETLFGLEGKLLQPINRANGLQAGDIFVSGRKGGSANAYGHTGFALNATEAIHCSSSFNGIGISSNSNSRVGAYSGAPVYWYRVIGSAAPTPEPTPTPTDKKIFITAANGGLEYYVNETLHDIIGMRMTTVDFPNITSDKDLLQKGKDWLADQPLDLQTLNVTMAQLNEINPYYKKIRLYDVVGIQVDILNIDVRMRVDKKSFSLEDTKTGELDFGRKNNVMTDLLIDRET